MTNSVENFYNPSVYRDAGLADPYGVRMAAVASPVRIEKHEEILAKTVQFFAANGIIENPSLYQGGSAP
jgi:hypothetical protein